MAAEAITEPTGKVEGATTIAAKKGALAGGGLGGGGGAAVANIIVFFAGEFGRDWTPIEGALTVILALIGGGWAARAWAAKNGRETPTDQATVRREIIPAPPEDLAGRDAAAAAAGIDLPAAAGAHRANTAEDTTTGPTATAEDPDADLRHRPEQTIGQGLQ